MKTLTIIFIAGILGIFGLMEQDRQKRITSEVELRAEVSTLTRKLASLEQKPAKPDPAAGSVKVAANPAPRHAPTSAPSRPTYTPPAPDVAPVAPPRVDNSGRIRALENQIAEIDRQISTARYNLRKKEVDWRIDGQKRGLRVSEAEKQQLRNQVDQYIAGLESQKTALYTEMRGL